MSGRKQALRLYKRGFYPIPLCWPTKDGTCGCGLDHKRRDAGKIPLVQYKQYVGSPPSKKQVKDWWKRWPNANIGILLEPSNLFIIDADSKSAIKEVEKLGLPKGPVVQSHSGRHYYYRRSAGMSPGNTIKRGESKKIDILASGFVVAPKSRHRKGSSYKWVRPLTETQRVEPPAWAVAWLQERRAEAWSEPVTGQRAAVDIEGLKASDKIKRLIRTGDYEDHYESRSEAVRAVERVLIKAGHTDATITAVLLDRDNGISGKPLEKGRTWVVKDIARAHGGLTGTPKPKVKPLDLLLEIGREAELFHTAVGDAYATFAVDGHHQTWPVRSSGTGHWLTCRVTELRHRVPDPAVVSKAENILEAQARYQGIERPVHVRVARGPDGAIYLDLANEKWEAVKITPSGWEIVSPAPVRFCRPPGMRSLPYPVSGGRLDELRRFINLRDADWPLVLVWILAALRPEGPYCILAMFGGHGRAKSTSERVIRRLVDPNAAPLRSVPKTEEDLAIAASKSQCLAFDNLSKIPEWLSDGLCRLATGGAYGGRERFKNTDEVLLPSLRPVVLSSRNRIWLAEDLLDRVIVISPPKIRAGAYRDEEQFWKEFDLAHARILGALLDAMAAALKAAPAVTVKRLPRMADFAKWGVGVERALGRKQGSFLAAYQEKRSQQKTAQYTSHYKASTLAQAIDEVVGGEEWSGTATKLLKKVWSTAADQRLETTGWPNRPNILTRYLGGPLGQVLRKQTDIRARFVRKGGKHSKRLIILKRT